MFCIKCGAPAAAGNFCETHFLEREKLFDLDNFSLVVCTNCKKVVKRVVNEREEYLEDVNEAIMGKIKSENKIDGCKIRTKKVGNRLYASVTCTGGIKPLKERVTQKRDVIVFFKRKMCGNCIKLSGGYYEAVFQVRGEQQERIIKKIEKMIPEEMVTDFVKLKEGYDIKVTNKRMAGKIAQNLRDYFSIKQSYKLVGKKKGKELHRNFYAVR